jgi:hypothetical protein
MRLPCNSISRKLHLLARKEHGENLATRYFPAPNPDPADLRIQSIVDGFHVPVSGNFRQVLKHRRISKIRSNLNTNDP